MVKFQYSSRDSRLVISCFAPIDYQKRFFLFCGLLPRAFCIACLRAVVPKLTPHQVKEALRRRDAGEPMRDIAKSYSVGNSTILRLIS
jgi:hypothetical protein